MARPAPAALAASRPGRLNSALAKTGATPEEAEMGAHHIAGADGFDATSTRVIHELVEIADYISHMRTEIAALRANEITRDRIPMAHEELGSVLAATAGATNTIMESAEAMLCLPDDENYRNAVELKISEIFEACAFQDITGQRIGKVVEALRHLELRLARFASAVKARDEAGYDTVETERKARAEKLLLNGPQLNGPETSQNDIDALFA